MLVGASPNSRPIVCLVIHISINYTPSETVSPTSLKLITSLSPVKPKGPSHYEALILKTPILYGFAGDLPFYDEYT